MSIIKLKGVSKFYYNQKTIASGFNKINLELDMGEFVVITGESGSGKSTLLNVISGLDSYEEGEMYINGEETSHYTESDYELYRRKYIGNIFQHFNLVNSYTVYQNIELALLFNGHKKKEIRKKILDIIDLVGLNKYKNTKASKLSGGQKQRVAIARALAKDTPIIVADEPTGNLDVQSAKSIMKLLHKISKDKLVVVVTHNYEQVSEYATRKIAMHDGRIVEDKKFAEKRNVPLEEIPFKNITWPNKILLGFRNAFNVKVKFLLLFFVYFFLTSIVFSEYTNLRKLDYDQYDLGYNYYFNDTSPNRIIVNKQDRSNFTKEELANVSKLDNISKVVEDDISLDREYYLVNDDNSLEMYGNIFGSVANIGELSSVDMGRMPSNENEIVIAGPEESYYMMMYKDKIIDSVMTLHDARNDNIYPENLKICGIKFIDDKEENPYMGSQVFYISDKVFQEMRKGSNVAYSTVDITINDHVFSSKTLNPLYFRVVSNKNLNPGEAYVLQNLNQYCRDYNCTNATMNIEVKNIYYEDSIDVKVKNYTTKDNLKGLTGLKSYEDNVEKIFISEEDFDKLFEKDTYQISVFLEDTKESAKTIKSLQDMGYNTIFMREVIVNEMGEVLGVINIVRGVVFMVATVILFFISYFIIKIILKSRNIYFSTIRILGATKTQANELLNIELLIDINIAYFVFVAIVLLTKSGTVNVAYVQDVITYFKTFDYIAVYVILLIMSLLISNRYAHKLFKNSAMSTYREEA